VKKITKKELKSTHEKRKKKKERKYIDNKNKLIIN